VPIIGQIAPQVMYIFIIFGHLAAPITVLITALFTNVSFILVNGFFLAMNDEKGIFKFLGVL